MIAWLVQFYLGLLALCAYLGGRTEEPPANLPSLVRLGMAPQSVLWGLWWGVLLAVVLVFCGQSSKFIYIDF